MKYLCSLLLLSLCLAAEESLAQATPAKPNFILFFVDDQGWTGTSVQMDPNIPNSKSDYYQTPNLERLASQGMRFNRAYSAGPNCSPTRASLQTGLSPAQLHYTNLIGHEIPGPAVFNNYMGDYLRYPNPVVLDTNAYSIADRLNESVPEYNTGYIHKTHLGVDPPDLGYDMFDFHANGYAPDGEDPAKIFSIANRANAYIEEQVQSDQPFFLHINQFAVHTPIVATTESRAYFDGLPRGTRHKDVNMAAMTYDLDQSLGMIMDKVDELGIADNTYIIYASDNGGVGASNAPLTLGKGHLLEGGIRVPLVVRGPGIDANTTSGTPVITTDLFATITDLAGVSAPLPTNSESASWRPIFENGGALPQDQALQRAYGENGELFFHFPHNANASSAVIDGDFKLLRVYANSATAQDSLLLFNLADNLTETYSVNSPLNLAAHYPEKTAELNAKLDRWLTGVDASMALPYDTPTNLEWSVEDFGGETGRWRSHLRVGNFRNETMQFLTPSYDAVATEMQTFQPGLADKGLNPMDGGGVGRWTLIASDNTYDTDNSATFDMWIKLDSMDQNQLVFESGSGPQGVSMTIGDADADGVHNDLRFRITTASGQTYAVTAPLDANANPLRDMIKVTGVVQDAGDRSISLFINGALVGTDMGTDNGAAPLDWDHYSRSYLGYAVGNTEIGGTSGSLHPAFVGQNFNGYFSKFGFRDSAISSDAVRDDYNSVLDPVTAGLAQLVGQVEAPAYRPTSTKVGVMEADSNNALIIDERSDVLDTPITVDLVASEGTFGAGMQVAAPGQLAGGTEFTSYLLHFDPASNAAETSSSGSVTFQNRVLGVIFEGASLESTNALLGSIGIYAEGQELVDLNGMDTLQLSNDLKTLTFNLTVSAGDAIQLRVLTEQAVVMEGIPGDFNYDGMVNLADYTVWRDTLGTDGFNLAADGNGDNVVNGEDYEIWKSHFGNSSPMAEAQSPARVPEPASVVSILLFVGVGLVWWRARK